MPQRLIVHAGFHKTGTTSIQRTLDQNRHALGPDIQVVLRPDMVPLCDAARRFSVDRSPLNLGFVQYEAAMVADAWTADTVLMSSEDLSGHMPGRRDILRYDAAPTLAAAMVAAWDEAMPGIEITLVYTVRAAADWLASCYVQHLRATRIKISAARYAQSFAPSADLRSIVAEVQAEVPDAEVKTRALEQIGETRLGPADALLDLADVPAGIRTNLPAAIHENKGLSAAQQRAFLDLNRSGLSDADVRARKSALS